MLLFPNEVPFIVSLGAAIGVLLAAALAVPIKRNTNGSMNANLMADVFLIGIESLFAISLTYCKS